MDQTIQYSHNEGRDGMGESGKGDTGRGWALSLIARGGEGGSVPGRVLSGAAPKRARER